MLNLMNYIDQVTVTLRSPSSKEHRVTLRVFTGHSRLDDDDEQSLIPHQMSKGSGQYLNEASNGDGESSLPSRKRRSRFTSWKLGVTMSASMTAIVLSVNIVLTVWASAKYDLDDGPGTAYEGSCDVVSAWLFWLHIFINSLSFMLLSASFQHAV